MDFLAKPFGVLMDFIYTYLAFDNYGLALILFTFITKLLLFPLTYNQQKSMEKQQELAPKIEELKKSYPNDPQKLQEEQQKLYSKYNVNPLSGCLPMLLQFPLIMALYQIIRQPALYISSETINMNFLGILKLDAVPAWNPSKIMEDPGLYVPLLFIPILTVATTYLQQYLSTKFAQANKPKKDEAPNPMNGLLKIMPVMTFIFAFMVPSGLGFYWTMGNVFGIIQLILIKKVFVKKKKEGSVINV